MDKLKRYGVDYAWGGYSELSAAMYEDEDDGMVCLYDQAQRIIDAQAETMREAAAEITQAVLDNDGLYFWEGFDALIAKLEGEDDGL